MRPPETFDEESADAVDQVEHVGEAQALEIIERHRRRFEVLHRVGERLAQIYRTDEIDQAYEIIVREAGREFDCQVVARRLDPLNQALVLVEDARKDPALSPRIPLDDPLAGRVVRERRTLAISDAESPPDILGLFPRSNADDRSFVIVPVLFEGTYYGNLALSHAEPSYFRDADVQLIEGLARQLAITIHRLEEATARQEAETMGEIGRQTYAIMHRIGNDLGLVRPLIARIRKRLAKSGESDGDVETALGKIEASVMGILTLSRTAGDELSKSARRTPERHRVKDLVDDAWQIVRLEEARREAIHFEVDIAPDTWEIVVDHAQFTDALVNLLTNAVEAMPDGGRLTVGARNHRGAEVKLWVEDTGRGISDALQPKIFDLGFTTREDGSGFGLWSVKRTVASHGGTIQVSSASTEGTTFTIFLPRTESAVARSGTGTRHDVTSTASGRHPVLEGEPGPPGGSETAPARILVVEDDKRWRQEIGAILRGEGFHVDTAATKAEAQERIETGSYDLLTLDLQLVEQEPEIKEGLEILRDLAELSPRPRVLVLTAYGTSAAMREAFEEHGVDDFIIKQTFDSEELLRQVRKGLSPGDSLKAGVAPPAADPDDGETSPRSTRDRQLPLYWERQSLDLLQAVDGLEIGDVLARSDAALRDRAAAELEQLLGMLFEDAQSLHLGSPRIGKSRTGVIVVRPEYRLPAHSVILKYGDRRRIKMEKANHRNFARYLGGARCSHLSNHDELDLLGGIVYSMLGAGDALQNFEDFYRRAPRKQVITVLNQLLTGTCGPWYASPKGPRTTLDLGNEYPKYLELDLATLGEAIRGLDVEIQDGKIRFPSLESDRWWVHPLAVLKEHRLSYPTYRTITHGDCNPRNIFVDEHLQAWLIDFARTDWTHYLRDVVELDTMIRIDLLAPEAVTLAERFALEMALRENPRFDQPLVVRESWEGHDPPNRALTKAYAVCQELRRNAGGLVTAHGPREVREFQGAAIFVLLARLRSPDLAPVQRQHALLSASIMAEDLWRADN